MTALDLMKPGRVLVIVRGQEMAAAMNQLLRDGNYATSLTGATMGRRFDTIVCLAWLDRGEFCSERVRAKAREMIDSNWLTCLSPGADVAATREYLYRTLLSETPPAMVTE